MQIVLLLHADTIKGLYIEWQKTLVPALEAAPTAEASLPAPMGLLVSQVRNLQRSVTGAAFRNFARQERRVSDRQKEGRQHAQH